MSNKFEQADQPLNGSGIEPCGHAVIVLPYEPKKPDSRIVLPTTVKDRTTMLEERGIVVAIGAECWKDESQPRAAVGDKVYLPYLAGKLLPESLTADGRTYRIVNDRDIYARIVKEK